MEKVTLLPGVAATATENERKRIPHLDGMRALAIIGVLSYHFAIPCFGGGFVGVDMFFTISGFLITRNILLSRKYNQFSLASFYLRRFFRLYPASAVTILFTLAVVYVTLRPAIARDVFMSAVAALTFWSNVWFHRQGGYFDKSIKLRPLLHVWSLSVEEQFYALWPPLLLIVSRFTRARSFHAVLRLVLVVLATLSFGFATWAHYTHPDWTFYELPSRIFQFAAGAYLAVSMLDSKQAKLSEADKTPTSSKENSERKLLYSSALDGQSSLPTLPPRPPHEEFNDAHDLLSVVATVIILISFSFLYANPPPILVLPTTLATCVLITVPDGVISDLVFVKKWPRWLGRISYSVYLVHWPMVILGRFIFIGLGIPLSIVVLLPVSVLLGNKLHKSIEEPLRRPVGVWRFAMVAAIVAGALGFAFGGVRTDGFKSRFPEAGATGWRPNASRLDFWQVCNDVTDTFEARDSNVKVCQIGDVQGGTRSPLIFFGDSFTEHLTIALHNIGIQRGIYFEAHISYHCGFRPSSELPIWTGEDEGYTCSTSHTTLWEQIRLVPNSSRIVVANWWCAPNRLDRVLFDLRDELADVGKRFAIFAEPPGIDEQYQSYYPCATLATLPLGRFIAKLTGTDLLGGARCLDVTHGLPPQELIERERAMYRAVYEKGPDLLTDVPFYDLFPYMCERFLSENRVFLHRCRVPARTDGVVYDIGYRSDLAHLSPVGSDYVTEYVNNVLYGSQRKTF